MPEERQANEALQEDAFVSVPLEAVPINMRLPYALRIKLAGRYVLFRAAGDLVTLSRIQALERQHVDTVFITKSGWDDFVRELENAEKQSQDPEKAILNLRHLLVAYGRQVEAKRFLPADMLNKLEALSTRLADAVKKNVHFASQLLRRYADPSLYFANHNINVAVYSLVIGTQLKLPQKDLRLLGFAALVHNTGNLKIPEIILHKTGPLDREEWDIVRRHPTEGAKILKALFAPNDVVATAKQHHECMDGSGYPEKCKGYEIHLFARIVRIADTFDALTSHRPHQKPLFPSEATDKMRRMPGNFDPAILSTLDS